MKNSTYWSNRMRILRESLLDTGYEYVQNLEAQYEMAIAEIDKKIAAWYQRFAKNNEISLAEAKRLLNSDELEEFKWTVRSYIEHGEVSALSGEWLKQLENASSRVHISRLDSLKLQLRQEAEALHGSQLRATESLLGDIYREGYFHTAFELQKGLGFGWSLHGMSASTIEKVLARPWTTDGQTFRDRVWTNKAALVNSVNTNLTQMIMRGEAPDRAIKAIAKQFGVSKGKAGRLVMTESAAFASAAQKDCFTELDVEEYKIIETLDQYTCDTCGALDGKVYKMSDFQVGVTAPPFHPWCRGCTAPYFADMDDWGAERAAKAADGKTYDVPANMKYSEWAKKAIKNPGISNENAKTPFTNGENRGIIDNRKMAMGLRQPASHILTDDEIESIKANAKALDIDESILRFNSGSATGFSDTRGVINIRGDILPDTSSKIARDCMSQRAVLAHEYYGHYLNHPSEFPIGDWQDEFRASYDAAVKAPNLTDEDRAYLMIDAYDRAHEAGQILNYDETARRIIYGF